MQQPCYQLVDLLAEWLYLRNIQPEVQNTAHWFYGVHMCETEVGILRKWQTKCSFELFPQNNINYKFNFWFKKTDVKVCILRFSKAFHSPNNPVTDSWGRLLGISPVWNTAVEQNSLLMNATSFTRNTLRRLYKTNLKMLTKRKYWVKDISILSVFQTQAPVQFLNLDKNSICLATEWYRPDPGSWILFVCLINQKQCLQVWVTQWHQYKLSSKKAKLMKVYPAKSLLYDT